MKNKKPIVTSTDEELNAELEEHSRSERGSALLIIAALGFEALVLSLFEAGVLELLCGVLWTSKRLEAIFFIIADLAIALGVYIEMRSGRRAKVLGDELQRRSRERVAEAEARADEARSEFARYVAARVLLPEQIDRVAEKVRQFAGIWYVGGVGWENPEFLALLEDIERALGGEKAGWIEHPWPPPSLPRLEKPGIREGVKNRDVVVGIFSALPLDELPRLVSAREALAAALNDEGIKATLGLWKTSPTEVGIEATAIMYVAIGPKT